MSTTELWNIITGCSSLQDPESIGKELNRLTPKLLSGLSFYKTPSASSQEKLKSSSAKRKEFLLNLSKVLNLDEWMTYELFQNYLRISYRGSGVQLQNILKHESQLEGFYIRLLNFYFKERLYLLKCIKYLLTYWQDDTCYFREEFVKVVDKIASEDVCLKFIKQLKELFKRQAGHPGIFGNRAAEVEFANEYIKEMCEFADIIFLYYKEFNMPLEVFMDLANFFKMQHFGYNQVNRKLLGPEMLIFIRRFGYTSSLILLEGIDLELIRKVFHNGNSDNTREHPLLKDNAWKKIDVLLSSWDDVVQQGPILMGWTIFRHTYLTHDEQQLTKLFGEAALKCNIFSYFYAMLDEVYLDKDTTSVYSLMKTFIYLCMSLSLRVFQEDSLCDYNMLVALASNVLSEKLLSSLFFSEDRNGGIGLLLKSRASLFPFESTPYIKMLTSLCGDSEGVDMVFESFENMASLTELFNKNVVDEIESLSEKVWTRKVKRTVLFHQKDEIFVPSATRGRVFQYQQETRLIQWQYSYSGWMYVFLELCHIIESPFTYQNDSGEDGLTIAKHYIKFINTILCTSPEKLLDFEPIISTVVTLFKRLMQAQRKPLELISTCLESVHHVIQQQPLEMWTNLIQIHFFPHQESSQISSTMHVGSYGEVILQDEILSNKYKITILYLQIISNMLNDGYNHLTKTIYMDLVANLVFVLKEIFPRFGSWRFCEADEKESIGLYCLEIFHKVLISPTFQEVTRSQREILSLKEIVREGLLEHGASDSLLGIVAVGVDELENSIESSKQKATIIQVIKLSLAVLNLLLTDLEKPGITSMNRLEKLISQQFVQQPSDIDFVQPICKSPVISVIAKYIFHSHDPKLPILAVLVLKRLAVRFPFILTSSFGEDIDGIRNAFVNKLNGRVEAIRTKVAVLEFLSVCVESQPGIIESFTQIQTDSKTKKKTFGKFSCLPAIMEIITNKSIVDVLTAAALDFIAALWCNRYDAAMMLLKKNVQFWDAITHFLKAENMNVKPVMYEVVNHSLNIVAVESYYVKSSQYDEKLQVNLKAVCTKENYRSIGKLFSVSTQKSEIKQKLFLLKGFHNYVTIMLMGKENCSNLDNDQIREEIVCFVLDGIKCWTETYSDTNFECAADIILQLSSFLWTFVRHCKRLLILEKHFETLYKVLQTLSKSDKETFYNTVSHLYLVFLAVLQEKDCKTSDGPRLELLFSLIICHLHFHKDDECMQSNHIKINKLSVSLMNELLSHVKKESFLLLVNDLNCQGTLRNLMFDVSSCLKKNASLDYVEIILQFFLTCSQKEFIVDHLYNCGFGKFVCLDLHNIQQLENEEHETILHLILSITSHLLIQLRHSFLKTAVDFIGAYESVLIKSMNVPQQLATHNGLMITEQLAIFCHDLVKYRMDVEFLLPKVFHKIKLGIGQMIRLSIALLSRQKYVNHVIECQSGEEKSEHLTNLSKSSSLRSDSFLSTYSNSERNDRLSQDTENAISRLISILCYSLASFRVFTPNVVESILDEGMDIYSFSPLVDLRFNPPSLELADDPSFGSLISCINISIKMIHTGAQGDSGRCTPEKEIYPNTSLYPEKRKSFLWFIIENAIIVILSQASCYLRHPYTDEEAKQFLKRELGSELTNFMYAVCRYRNRRGVPASPECSERNISQFRRSPSKLSSYQSMIEEEENSLLNLVDLYTKNLLR